MNNSFQSLGVPHITAMILTVVVPIVLASLVRKADSPKVTRAICYLLGSILLVNEVGVWVYRLVNLGFSVFVRKYLPLHICGLSTFVTVFTLLKRNQFLYETVYFWGLAGTIQAVLTPGELEVDFPKYRFFQYFMAHGGIIAGVLFATLGLRMRPTLKSLFRTFFITNAYMVFIAGVNLLLKSNYMFICDPPATNSPFFFAPWPWYIPILDGVALIFFFIVYAPFLIRDWVKFHSIGGQIRKSL